MSIRRLKLVALLSIVVAGLFVPACRQRGEPSTPQPTAAPGSKKITLTLFIWVRPEEQQANQELAAQFEKQHPNIRVEVRNTPSQQAMDQLQVLISGGTPPDVMSIHGARFAPLADKGVLANLEPFIAQDKSLNLPDFFAPLVELCRYKGTLYSLPRYTSVYTLFYNKDLFDAAGLAYPDKRAQWTWDDFLAAARKITRDLDGDGKPDEWGCVLDFWGSRLYPWIWQNGGDLLSPDGTRSALDTPQTIQALEFLVSLKTKYHVTPGAIETQRRETLELFRQGKVGMYMTGPWDVQAMDERPNLRWDVGPLPSKARRATILGLENYAIAAASPHKQEGWQLLAFLLSPESQAFMARRLGKMPSRKSVATGEFLKIDPRHNYQAFVDAVEYGVPPRNLPDWDQIEAEYQKQLDLIWQGEKTPAQGARDAASAVNKILAARQKKEAGK